MFFWAPLFGQNTGYLDDEAHFTIGLGSGLLWPTQFVFPVVKKIYFKKVDDPNGTCKQS